MDRQVAQCGERRNQQDAADANGADQGANAERGHQQPDEIRQEGLIKKPGEPGLALEHVRDTDQEVGAEVGLETEITYVRKHSGQQQPYKQAMGLPDHALRSIGRREATACRAAACMKMTPSSLAIQPCGWMKNIIA
jgi:hypothetical protein